MKKFYILPKRVVVDETESKSAEDAIIDFATDMDSDMNQYFMASDTIMKRVHENSEGAIFAPFAINSLLFNVYVLRKRNFKDGTSRWAIGIELKSDSSKYMILDTIRGTREDAVKRLEEIIAKGR